MIARFRTPCPPGRGRSLCAAKLPFIGFLGAGVACALADWTLVASGVVLTFAILFGLGWIERRMMSK